MMKRQWTAFKSLTVASVKMYVRNVTGLFFTLFLPVLLIIVFGFLFKNNNYKTKIALTNYSQSGLSEQFVEAIKKIEAFDVASVDEGEARSELGKGKVDLQIVVPKNFGELDPQTRSLKVVKIQSYYNEARPQAGQTSNLILGQILSNINNTITKTPVVIGLEAKGVKTNNLGQIDFFLPGVIAMSIMQLGIFSVAFGFIAFKTTGALRRLQATPVHPINFILGQSVARLMVTVVQILLLLAFGMWLFGAKLVGSLGAFMFMGTIGALAFIAFGFAVAGWAKDENQAAPVAQLIQLPMLFLSGVFFPREGLPTILQKITDYLPLTYLVDGMRRIANEGATLWQVRGDVIGLLIWAVVVLIVAVRIFKWE